MAVLVHNELFQNFIFIFFFNLILIYDFVLIFSFFTIIIVFIFIFIFIFIYFIFRYGNYRPPQNSFTFFSLMKFSIPPTFDELFKHYLSVFEELFKHELFKHLLATKFSSCVSNSPNHTYLNYYLQRRIWGCCNIQDGVLCDSS